MRQKRQVYAPECIFNLLSIGDNVDIETSLCESIGLPEIFATYSPLYGGILPNNTQFHCHTRTPRRACGSCGPDADARSAATARRVEIAHVNATWYQL